MLKRLFVLILCLMTEGDGIVKERLGGKEGRSLLTEDGILFPELAAPQPTSTSLFLLSH